MLDVLRASPASSTRRKPRYYGALRRPQALTREQVLLQYREEPSIDAYRHFHHPRRKPTHYVDATAQRLEEAQAMNKTKIPERTQPAIILAAKAAKGAFRHYTLPNRSSISMLGRKKNPWDYDYV